MILAASGRLPLQDRRLAGLALFLAVWTIIAVCAATTTFIALGRSGFDQWLGIFGYMSSYFYAWGAVSFAIHWLARRQDGSGFRWYVQLPLHVLLLVLVAALMPFILQPEQWRVWLYGERAVAFHSLNAFVYAFVLAGSMTLSYYRVSRRREKEVQAARLQQFELERSLDRSRIDALRAQINPHFLFNTLNSIASLVESGANREAYEVIEKLAALLRNALEFSREDLVVLEEELDFLDAYLAIEYVRFGERLRVTRSVPSSCLGYFVPALSLQPLLENVVKHAISATSDPVSVHIDISERDGRLQVTVADDGPGVAGDADAGVGLSNVRDRLLYLYGVTSGLTVRNNAQGGATVTLAFPAHESLAANNAPLAKKFDRPEERGLSPVPS